MGQLLSLFSLFFFFFSSDGVFPSGGAGVAEERGGMGRTGAGTRFVDGAIDGVEESGREGRVAIVAGSASARVVLSKGLFSRLHLSKKKQEEEEEGWLE